MIIGLGKGAQMLFDHFVDMRHAAAAAGTLMILPEHSAWRDEAEAIAAACLLNRFADVLAG